MDKVSSEEDKKGTSAFLITILPVLAAGAIVSALFTNYKEEIFICNKSKNICTVEKTNLINQKSVKYLFKYSDISEFSYFREKIKGNRYAKGYSAYILTVVKKDNNPAVVFSGAYYNKKELNSVIKNLTNQLRNNQEGIKLIKNQ